MIRDTPKARATEIRNVALGLKEAYPLRRDNDAIETSLGSKAKLVGAIAANLSRERGNAA
jgi:hypothetical protein